MAQLLIGSSGFCGLWLVAVVWLNVVRRGYDVLSVRNLTLLGFFHFFVIGSVLTATGAYWDRAYSASDGAMATLAIAMPVFLVFFLLGNHGGFRAGAVSRLIPSFDIPPTGLTVLAGVLALLVPATLFSFLPFGGFFGLLFAQFKSGMAAAAVALATYYIVSNKFQPVAWGVFLATLPTALLVSITGGSGRRFALSVLLAVPFMLYFCTLRYNRMTSVVLKTAPLAAAALAALALYSGVRHDTSAGFGIQRSIQLVQRVINEPRVFNDALWYMLYTDTSNNTMFLLETVPEDYAHQPLAGAVWFVTNPIPRGMWPDKPDALGVILQDYMATAANLGPGVIGHGWYEAGWIGIIYYALFLGLLAGIVDRKLADRADCPFLIAIVAASLGNVIAFCRGDTPLFLIQAAAATFSTGVVLLAIKVVLGPVGAALPQLPRPGSPAILRKRFDPLGPEQDTVGGA